MPRSPLRALSVILATLALSACAAGRQTVLVVDAGRLFDGRTVIDDARMVIADGRVQAVGTRAAIAAPGHARTVDLGDKVVMPGMIAAHSHVGTVSGTEHGGRFYSRETVTRDLAQFQRYGVVAVNALGLNRPLFHSLRADLRGPGHGGADLYGAGAGIGAVDGAPPVDRMGVLPDQARRAGTPDEAREAVRAMADAGVDMIKFWVDGMGGQMPRMAPGVYAAVIEEAHARGLPVAAHIHDLDDAKGVVQAGVDIVAHGIRDQPVDAAFVRMMQESRAWYIPTVNIDEANYIYAQHPEWLDDPFFKASLSPEVEARLRDPEWRARTLAGADKARRAVEMNLRNLRTLHAAGIKVAMGTDSGATALRIPGFAEHRELELMTLAGLTPAEALSAATANAAELMRLPDRGRLAPGQRADFLVLDADPTADIRATRTLRAVWRDGRPVE